MTAGTSERRREAVQFRADPDTGTVSGIAVTYGEVSPKFNEMIRAGAFDRLPDVRLNLQHTTQLISDPVQWINGPDALRFRAEGLAPGVRALAKRSGIGGASMEYFVLEEHAGDDGAFVVERARLTGLALVDRPAFVGSTIRAAARGRVGTPVSNPWIKSQWQARKSGSCGCQGDSCDEVSFEPGAFDEAISDGRELLALAGSNRPLASRKKGSLSIVAEENGDVSVALDRAAAVTPAGQALASEMDAVRVVARPWVDVEASEYTQEGRHRKFTKAALRGVIVKGTVDDDGWEEIQKAEQRRRRVWL